MAEIKKQMIACPKCKKNIEVGIWDKIELPYDADQKEKVLRNVFFKVHCDTCNILFPIAYRCQYNDLENKYLIWLVPRMDDRDKADIEAYNQRLKNDNVLRLAQGGYRYRIVRNDNELREKVFIFDEGLDDRFIETMKLMYVPMFKSNVAKDHRIMGLYFDKKKDGGYQWVIILEKMMQPLLADVNMEIYEDMKVKLKDIVEEMTPEGLAQIYALWAKDVLNTQVERATAEKQEAEE